MYDYFLTIGLQRTGTKWLSELIKSNFKTFEAEYVWKHLTPLGVYPDEYRENPHIFKWSRMEEAVRDYFIVAVYKDYDQWYTSLLKNNDPSVRDPYSNVDFFDTHNTDNTLPYDARVSMVYTSWMKWVDTIKDQDNVYLTSYNNWLNDPEYHLEAVYEKSGFSKLYKDWIAVDRNLDDPKLIFVKE